MIIIDFRQLVISTLQVQLGNHTNAVIEPSMFRHMTLETIRSIRTKHKAKFGDLVIATDGKNYWRKQFFPHYKAKRKDMYADSELDWDMINDYIRMMTAEIRDNFSYPMIEVENAEADDIIATLCMNFGSEGLNYGEPILIVSSDKDFIQLQRFGNVQQFSPKLGKMLKHPNPLAALKEHIINGDRGDGIPNFLSQDDSFVAGVRQKSVMKTKLAVWLKQEPEEFCNEAQLKNYQRNSTLIDFTQIPKELQERIMAEYNNQQNKSKGKLMNYFIKNKLRNLMTNIGDF